MKNSKFLKIFIGLFLFVGLVSCSNDDEMSTIRPSTSFIEMEAEGGKTEISFSNGDWQIAEVQNQNGNVVIWGNTYSQAGEMLKEESMLSLEDQGRMETLWDSKGFIIIRNTPSSLEILLKENSTGEEFDFTIVLKSGEEVKKIEVFQKKTQGYQFSSIEFSLEEEDGDSIFFKKGTTYRFSGPRVQEITVSPYGGIDVHKHSLFLSSEKDAFVWLEKDSIMVEVPTDIYYNELYFNGEQRLYGQSSSKNPHGFEEMATVTISAGQSEFFFEQEWRKRQVSYQLNLINNRTGEEKIIEGKWIETAPTGGYSIHWEE
jgi:hypothetical protein